MSEPLVKWIKTQDRWELHMRNRSVATVWMNGVWHTWDRDGNGGENSAEDTVAKAKVEAAASAIAQGFI